MPWMTPPEYAAYRKMSLSKANKDRVTGGGPPYIKTGRLVRYDSRRVDEWLSAQERRSTSEPPPPAEAEPTIQSPRLRRRRQP